MKTAIILHGMPEEWEFKDPKRSASSNCHWLPWIQRQLVLNGILAQTPEMPTAYKPEYEAWKKMFERFDINEDTTLIGHSCGGGFIVRYLSENKVKVGRVVLVAPWLDLDDSLGNGMFKFEIDPELVSRTKGLILMSSRDDVDEVVRSVQVLKKELHGAKIIEFADKGHFCFDDLKTNEFPELLQAVLE
ncbi:MAG TPA: alpha/beta hydrolase [Candidatus Paceibacterota bacterium]